MPNKNTKQMIMLPYTLLVLALWICHLYAWHKAMLLLIALLVFCAVLQLNWLNDRISQLEQPAQRSFVPVYLAQWGIYLGGIVGLTGFLFDHAAITFLGFAGLVVSFLQLFSGLSARLSRLETQKESNKTSFSTEADFIHSELNPVQHVADKPAPFDVYNVPITEKNALPDDAYQDLAPPTTDTSAQMINTSSSLLTWWQKTRDWMVRGNPILKIAIVILMIGVVLLLRFASEHWQLDLKVKLLGIAVAGMGLTGLGYYLYRKNALFAVALQGVGLAIVFLTLFFSHYYAILANLYVVIACFILILGTTIILSLKQSAVYLSILALGMAYLAPLLIPHSHPDSLFIFSYYLFINIAVAAINFFKPWKVLNHLAFWATGGLGGAIITIYAQVAEYPTLDLILWLHIALFIWLSIRYSQLSDINKQQSLQLYPLRPVLDVGLIFSVPVLGFTAHAMLMLQSSLALTVGAILLACVYGFLAAWIKIKQPNLSVLAKSFFILAIAFTALIFPLYQGARWTAVGWVVQGAALVVWGVSERDRLSRYLGLLLLILSSGVLFYQIWSDWSSHLLSTTIYSVSLLVAAYHLFKLKSQNALFTAAITLSLALCSAAYSSVHYFSWQSLGLSAYAFSAIAVLAGFIVFSYYRAQQLSYYIIFTLMGFILLLSYNDLVHMGLFNVLQWDIPTQQFLFLASQLLLSTLLIFVSQHSFVKQNQILRFWWSMLIWFSLAGIGATIFVHQAMLALALGPIVYSLYLWWKRESQLLLQRSIWFVTLVWLLYINLIQQNISFYYVPLLNQIDAISLTVLLALIWAAYQQQYTDQEQIIAWMFKVSTVFTALFIFSSVMVRTLHQYIGTPLWQWSIWSSGPVQLSLTLLWTILAFILTTTASRKQIRELWFIGAGLIVVIVVKLVGLDLAQSATLTRVISFIGAGGVMLVIAYIAPIPPIKKPVSIEKDSL